MNKASVLGLGMLVGLTSLPAALAQEQERSTDVGLEEIVVTARKVEERLLDVPLTITAFSEKAIEEQGANGIRDLAVATPSLYVSASSGSRSGDRIALRGLSGVLPTVGYVGIYIDGVFIPSSSAQAIELSNVERIEVIKGPQSAIFGRSTLSGAINYVTRRPGDEWGGRVSASLGEFEYQEYSANLTGPINDQFSFLVGGRYYSRGALYRNQFSGVDDVGGQSSRNGTLGLRFTPNENFEAYFRVLASRDSDQAAAVYLQNSLFNNCLVQAGIPTYFCGKAEVNPNGISVVTANSQVPASVVVAGMSIATRGTYTDDGRAGMDRDTARAMLELSWTLGDFTLTSLSGYGAEKTRDANDLTTRGAIEYASTVGLPSITFDRDIKFKDFQQELRVGWDSGGRISALGGVYYYRAERTEFLPYRSLPQADAGRLESTNTAVFGRLQFDATDKLSIAGEARYQQDKVDYFNGSNFVPNTTNPITAEAKTNRFLPRVTIDYNLTDGTMLYALFSKGNRPVTINTAPELAFCNERQKTKEEQTRNFEVGFKGRLFDNRITLQTSVYDIEWTNQEQSGVLQPGECGGVNTNLIRFSANGGQTQVRGIELEANANVIPDWLTARLSYSIADTEITDARANTATEATEGLLAYPGANFTALCGLVRLPMAGSVQSPLCPSAPAGFVNTLIGGQFLGLDTDVPAQAERLFSASATLERPLGGTTFRWFVRGDYLRASKVYESVFNLAWVGPRENVNLRAGFRSDTFEFTLWARNLTDDDTATTILRSVAFRDDDGTGPRTANSRSYSLYLPEPRTFGATLAYRF